MLEKDTKSSQKRKLAWDWFSPFPTVPANVSAGDLQLSGQGCRVPKLLQLPDPVILALQLCGTGADFL